MVATQIPMAKPGDSNASTINPEIQMCPLSKINLFILTIWFNFVVNMSKSTETRILNTARKHFVRNGFAGTRTQEIANDAGINKALLHYYFRTKEKLYQEVIDSTLDTIIPPMAEAMGRSGSFAERLERIVEVHLTTLMAHPDIPMFILSELSQRQNNFIEKFKKQAEFFPAIQSFVLQMSMEMDEGIIRKVPPLHLLLNIIGLIVFPFVAKPIFQVLLSVEQGEFEELMQDRKQVVLKFIQMALLPENKTQQLKL